MRRAGGSVRKRRVGGTKHGHGSRCLWDLLRGCSRFAGIARAIDFIQGCFVVRIAGGWIRFGGRSKVERHAAGAVSEDEDMYPQTENFNQFTIWRDDLSPDGSVSIEWLFFRNFDFPTGKCEVLLDIPMSTIGLALLGLSLALTFAYACVRCGNRARLLPLAARLLGGRGAFVRPRG